MNTISLRVIAAASGIAGGAAYAFLGMAWAMTHGSLGYNQERLWLGIDNLTYSRWNVFHCICFLVLLLALRPAARFSRPSARRGYYAAAGALAAQLVSQVLQYHVVNTLVDWRSLPVTLGYLMFWVSWLVFGVSMIVCGAAWREQPAALRIAVAATGLLAIATFAAETFVFALHSDGSPAWDVFLGVMKLPFALGWIALSIAALGLRLSPLPIRMNETGKTKVW
ncbi:hypothetical protein [Paenibacillus sp.]|uniref:hypothetical protein n=1 Tax=Paenibacillus sp. TaxID=58172 RepID=UPI002D511796|nr:hypothetical protein [Paenibacillus sp.]HZG84718.1 hypothetical protein [Paenibacillus sp.]